MLSTSLSASPADPSVNPGPNLPSDDYAYVSKNDVTMVLSTGQITIDDQLDFKTSSYILYAETIVLTASKKLHYTISLPGKHIGLFCNTLDIKSTPNITLDVSGEDGDDGVPDSTISPTKGKNGGSITLYVERLESGQVGQSQQEVSTGLFLHAFGGRGGRGISVHKSGLAGGDGADGGNGANLSLFIILLKTRLTKRTSCRWAARTAAANKTLVGLDELSKAGITPGAHVKSFGSLIASYLSLVPLIQTLSTNLESLITSHLVLSSTLLQSLQALQKLLKTLSKSSLAPACADDLISAINDIALAVNQLRSLPSGSDKTAVEEALQVIITENFSKFSPSSESAFDTALSLLYNDCLNSASSMEVNLQRLSTNVTGGIEGQPGSGDVNVPNGKSGVAGNPGTIDVSLLTFQGDPCDLQTMKHALAQPDQAQMILTKADNLYFTGTLENNATAAKYYQRLSDRLAFVPALVAATASTSCAIAYNDMEFDDKGNSNLTVNALNQLQNIHSRALANLGQIILGQDMFGHALSWTPRLSYTFYDERATKLITSLQTVEKAYKSYYTDLQNKTEASTSLDDGLAAAQQGEDQANAQITLITDPNGPLDMYDSQIAAFTPLLKAKRTEVSDYIKTIIHLINEKSFSFDPSTWINCLSTIAMAPTEFNAAVSVFQAGYSSMNQITALDGTKVDRTYVVSQLEQCDGTLESLQEAYTNRSDGSAEVDDPGAAKIIMLQSQLDSLLDKFQSAISGDIHDKVEQLMKDYVALIKQRNDAVIALNSTLQILYKTRQDQKYYHQQHSAIGQKKNQIDPTLPAVCYWLKKSCTDMALLVLQTLNYGAHAIQFWGPLPLMAFDTSGGLPSSVQLISFQTALETRFSDALEAFGSRIPSTWPPARQLGVCYRLTDGELVALTTATNTTEGDSIYSVVLRQLVAPTSSSQAPENPFAGRANVRITQVRLWLPGATLDATFGGSRPLLCKITHLGDETIVDSTNNNFKFVHDRLDISWGYDTTGIMCLRDCVGASGQLTEKILEGTYNGNAGGTVPGPDIYAPVGPFATWQITIRSGYNPGLDLSKVEEAYLEFWGSHAPFS
ncbi:hypothetical protein QFC19_003687 [Naganishia cerealis]|uniref:Uncharacterized protein n=1 Tax=Naganishia cerealis TaxID=610337 RepID=A0ACC2VZZ2_9TREE|nr:hypothetical protein QFC19_003687 [Naganishia cerealis]